MRLLVTGGAGFIGSNFIHFWLGKYPTDEILNMDVGLHTERQLANLTGVDDKRYFHTPVDLTNYEETFDAINRWGPHAVVHCAAETGVNLSLDQPRKFLMSNVVGTFNLLEALKEAMPGLKDFKRILHVSADEVFGSLRHGEVAFHEGTAYRPRSPYAASKAASDHFMMAYYHSYGLPVVVTSGSSVFGPRQGDDKLIPTIVRHALAGEKIPIHGVGTNVRDWMPVDVYCQALDFVFNRGMVGESYCIGGSNEWANIELAHEVCSILDRMAPKKGRYRDLISFVDDNSVRDFRYAIDISKLRGLGFNPKFDFHKALEETVYRCMEQVELKRVRSKK